MNESLIAAFRSASPDAPVDPVTRDRLCAVVEAAEACVRTWRAHGFTHNHIPDALILTEAVEAMEADRGN